MTANPRTIVTANGEALDRDAIPEISLAEFRETVLVATELDRRVSAFFGRQPDQGDGVELYAVLADDVDSQLHVTRTRLTGKGYPSLTRDCPQVHMFEREIAEQFGVEPEGHPWLKPVRFSPRRKTPGKAAAANARAAGPTIGVTDFYRVEGEEVHEVAVGPVHAGIIEPGHFRFQCHGEEVFHLEISLGYQHRGIERAMVGGPNRRTFHLMETLAGDTTIGHALAYCRVLEVLGGCQVPARAQALRGIALELERLANHTGDLGALAGDVGFLPTAAYCGRLRGEFLNLTALVCGNRFGRGLLRPGGVGFDVDGLRAQKLLDRLARIMSDLGVAVELLWSTPSVMARFEGTGPVDLKTCDHLGLVGPVARACGATRDVRHDHPSGVFRFAHIPVSSSEGGDVFSRAHVRWLEIQRSARFIQEQLGALPGGRILSPVELPGPRRFVATLIEGWRGEICHVATTGDDGRFQSYKVVDPSFHNWTGLAMALRGQPISDFPLCNKSFNLSYCGHDL